MLSSGTIDIISSSFRNVVRVPEFLGFFLIFLLFHQFSYQEDIFLISSKTSNILKTNTCSKEHSYLFPDNLNAFKVNKNSNIQQTFPKFNDVSYSQIGNGAKRDKRLACNQRKVNTNTFQINYFSNEFQIYWYLFLFFK